MSDNTKKTGESSLGSEGDDTTDPEKERLQMRRILVEQQQHLLSHYNHSIRNSGDDDTEDFNFIREAPTQHETQRVKTPSELSIIAQQQQCLDDIISARIEGETVLTHSDVDSERVVASKAESPVSHLSVVNPPKEVVYPVRVKPSRSTGDKPTQKHDEDRFVGEVITCGGKSKSKIEPFDQVASSSASSEVPNQAGNINMPNRTSPAHAAWLRTEQELGEYFSNIDNIESESRPNAEPKRLPEKLLHDDVVADLTRIWLEGGKSEWQPPRTQESTGRSRGQDDEDMDDRKPPAYNQKEDDDKKSS